MRCLIVIPCLNEVAHIGPLLDRLAPVAERLDGLVVVADGGSTDGTQEHLRARAGPRMAWFHNARRIQSAGINAAVTRYGDGFAWLVRIDAHGDYPDDFVDQILADAATTGADSIVVGMVTEGRGTRQRAAALAQNSRLGNGGSAHRAGGGGAFVDHGHHAAMRIEAFRAVGGYDESFSHNEDAELDHRLRAAGFRIWMTGRTQMTYYPRASFSALGRQYFGYGKGRAMNLMKHRGQPRLRQLVPVFVLPVVAMAVLAPLSAVFALPALAYLALCLGYGAVLGIRSGGVIEGVLAGCAAMVMHIAWSGGFWAALLRGKARRAVPA